MDYTRIEIYEHGAEEKVSKAAGMMNQARQEMLKAEQLRKKFEMDREYWQDVRKHLDWAAYQLADKLGL